MAESQYVTREELEVVMIRVEVLTAALNRLGNQIADLAEDAAAFREQTVRRFDAMDSRFDAMDSRFDAMDKRFNDADTTQKAILSAVMQLLAR